MAFARSGDIYVMKADGSDPERISDINAQESDPAWSPDGNWIAYIKRTPGTPVQNLWVMRPDGSGRRALTRQSGRTFTPAWSPDSIVFSMNRDETVFELFTIGVDGKGLRSVVPTAGDNFEPAWSPDGSKIAYQEDGAIFTVELGGGDVERLPTRRTTIPSRPGIPHSRPTDDHGSGIPRSGGRSSPTALDELGARSSSRPQDELGPANAFPAELDGQVLEVQAARVDVRCVPQTEFHVHRRRDPDDLWDLVEPDEAALVVRNFDVDVERRRARSAELPELGNGQVRRHVDRRRSELPSVRAVEVRTREEDRRLQHE